MGPYPRRLKPKNADTKVHNTTLNCSRVIYLQASSWDINISRILGHEKTPVPTSKFVDKGEHRTGKVKSALKKQLHVEVSGNCLSGEISCSVIDGSALLYTILWPLDGTLSDFFEILKHSSQLN